MRCICMSGCGTACNVREVKFSRESKKFSISHNKIIASNCAECLNVVCPARIISMSVQSKSLDEKDQHDIHSTWRRRVESSSTILSPKQTGTFSNPRKSEEINKTSADTVKEFRNAERSFRDERRSEATHQNPEDVSKFDGDDDNAEYVTKIPVPRQRYISVSKLALVRSLLSNFSTKAEASNFLSICSCLESILHAEHRLVLEELRLDYRLNSFSEDERWLNATDQGLAGRIGDEDRTQARDDHKSPKSGNGAISSSNSTPSKSFSMTKETDSVAASRNSLAARFQKNLMSILESAQFQELSVRDLQLTTTLNSNYLLTLPIEIDWKSSSSENMIVFRRGYARETQRGLLFGEKFDYLQSLLLRKIFNGVAEPVFRAGRWCIQRWELAEKSPKGKAWTEGIKRWLEEPLYPSLEEQIGMSQDSSLSENDPVVDYEYDLTIGIAARRAMPRYEAVLSSVGSRGILLKRFLVWIGLLPSNMATFPLLSNSGDDTDNLEPHLRPNYLPRISMRDIWLPASKSLCGNDSWRRLKASFSIFFSSSTLEEPAFEELVVLYTKVSDATKNISDGFSSLNLNIYKKIPIPDLKVIFPNKKLSFRIVDVVRLDLTAMVGIVAFFVNYKYVDLLSSPNNKGLCILEENGGIYLNVDSYQPFSGGHTI